MPISQISANSVLANPVNVNPKVKTDQVESAYQANQNSKKDTMAIKSDTVTISQEAIQKLAKDADIPAQEGKEKSSEQASEKAKGKA
jgi:hypothetical protein